MYFIHEMFLKIHKNEIAFRYQKHIFLTLFCGRPTIDKGSKLFIHLPYKWCVCGKHKLSNKI